MHDNNDYDETNGIYLKFYFPILKTDEEKILGRSQTMGGALMETAHLR